LCGNYYCSNNNLRIFVNKSIKEKRVDEMKKSMNERILECIKGRAEEKARELEAEREPEYDPDNPDHERR
jgi:hypothetical protein